MSRIEFETMSDDSPIPMRQPFDIEPMIKHVGTGQPFDRADVVRLMAAYQQLQRWLYRLDAVVQEASEIVDHMRDDQEFRSEPGVQRVFANTRKRRKEAANQ